MGYSLLTDYLNAFTNLFSRCLIWVFSVGSLSKSKLGRKHDSKEFHCIYVLSKHFTRLKGALSGLRQLLAMESPLKMMKNAFYFTSKALFVLKIFKFLSCVFFQNDLIKKIRLISSFMTSQPG